jgi:hypothetical protein
MKDKDDNNSSLVEDLIDLGTKAKEVYEKHGDKLGDKGQNINLDSPDPLTEAHVRQDHVEIVSEVGAEKGSKIGFSFPDGPQDQLRMEVSGESFTFDIPDDINEDSVEATVKNGVLTVTMERESDQDDTVAEFQIKEEEEIEEEEENDGGDE